MRVLVIGMGSIGRRHYQICNDLGHKVRGFDMVGDWPALDWDWPDAIFVCTPPASHLYYATGAIQSGKRLMVEKPLGLPGEVERWAELARYDFAVGYQMRYVPEYQAVKKWADKLGVSHGTFWYQGDIRAWRPGDYRQGYICLPRENGGGIVMDASHEIDTALWMCGMPETVECHAFSELEGMAAESYAVIELAGADWTASIMLNGQYDGYSRAAIVGTRCGHLLGHWAERWQAQAVYEDQDMAFLAGESLSTGRSALDTLRVIAACHRSIETGKVVRL